MYYIIQYIIFGERNIAEIINYNILLASRIHLISVLSKHP